MKALMIFCCFFLFPMSVNAETICKVKHFSALPHSFSGVAKCTNEKEWINEGIARCKQKASEIYPSVPSVSFSFPQVFAPGYSGSYILNETDCTATFNELNCNIEVCRTVDETF